MHIRMIGLALGLALLSGCATTQYRPVVYSGVSRGNYEDAEAKVSEGQLVWDMKIPQFGDVRYTIKLDDRGQWFEIGEVSRDGKTWQQFFEMTLQRGEAK